LKDKLGLVGILPVARPALKRTVNGADLYYHPLSSYCHKALIALYESGTAFTSQVVDLSDRKQTADFKALWPMGKFPVLTDGATVVPESTSIIEYLATQHPAAAKLIPADPKAAFTVRDRDRFFDLHVHFHTQKIITDRIRPAGGNDIFGVQQSREALDKALGIADGWMAKQQWAAGDAFSMADCAAAPPLFYADLRIEPLAGRHGNLAAYLERMKQRPSYARALKEAEPYLHMVPQAS
jgi:glutathione S-transferase